MFTNENFDLSQNDELLIRKYVNSNYFDVEEIIKYINENNIITVEIFTKFLTEKGKQNVQLTYLKEFKNVSKDTFIKRVPIYFYDVRPTSNNNYDELCDIFAGFAFFTRNNIRKLSEESLEEDVFSFEDKEKLYEGIDFEPLYQMLEKILYTYRIPFEKVIEYFVNQCGNFQNFGLFYKWIRYLELLSEVNEKNVFPFNILYAYNSELVKNGKDPIIYQVQDFHVYPPKKGGRKMILRGEFPFDENRKIALEWIGLWCENVGEINLRERNINGYVPDFLIHQMNASLSADISIDLKNNSLVFISKDVNDEEGNRTIWEQKYCGPKRIQFDHSIIMQRREKLGMSQKEASDNMDINLRTYQRIEAGDSTPDGLNLIKIMNFYGLNSYDDFVVKPVIEDINYKKFLSKKSLSLILNE